MKAAVIGSGLSGLVSAALLARKGVQVDVFEQNDFFGGVTSTAKKNGYEWEQGPLLLCGFLKGESSYNILKELDIELETVRGERGTWTPAYAMWRPKEYTGRHWRRERLKELFPQEKRGIDAYYRFYERIYRLMYLASIKNPSAVQKLRLALTFLSVKKYAGMNAEELCECFFKDKWLKTLFIGILADFCVSPKEFQCFGVPVTNCETAFDIRIPREEKGERIYPGFSYISGGTEKLVNALVKAIEDAGGCLHSGAQVDKILVEDNKVKGLRVKLPDEGETDIKADIVVASGGMREVFYKLLGRENLGEEYASVIDGCRTMDGVFMVHLGVDFDPLQYQQTALCYYYKTYDIDRALETMRSGVYHDGKDGFLIYVPSAHSPSMAPEGKHCVTIYTVCPDTLAEGSWEELRETFAEHLIEQAEEFLPELSKHICEMQIMTPVELRKLTHLDKSAFGGVVPQMDVKKPACETPVEGLYFVGAQSESGGGIDNVMNGARRAFSLIEEKYSL